MKDQPLQCSVEVDELVIRIGISTLAFALKDSPLNNPFNEEKEDWLPLSLVIDEMEFAKDVTSKINDEAEDGTTPLHLFLDKMMETAIEDGSLGVEEINNVRPQE